MSEMSAEKKKEIEKYIIKSYFGGGKNVESLANGADVIKGTDDGYIPQLIVEVTYFGESGIVMIKWNVYCDSQQNSFSMRICRERGIERNRCDSVDAMSYAWEAWRAKIQGKPVFLETNEKDKCIEQLKNRLKLWQDVTGYSTPEFYCNDISIRNEELEKEIKALRAEKEVMERHIQELESYNVSLAETNAVLNNKLKDMKKKLEECEKDYISERDKVTVLETEAEVYSRALIEWKEGTGCPSPSAAKNVIDSTESWHQAYRDVKATNEKLADNVKSWQKATGYSTPEGFLSAMTKYSDNVWRDATECKTLVDIINGLNQEIDNWQKATGRINPEAAKQYIDRLTGRLNKIHDYSVDW